MRDKDEVNKKILDKEAIISELKSQLYGNVEEENNGSRNAMPDATMFQSFTDQNSTFSDNNVTITENQLSDGMHVSEEQISTYARISSIPSTSTAPVPKPSLPVTSHPTPAAVTKKQDKISAYRRMLVVGDSHCRGIGDVFKNYVPNKCHVKVICKPDPHNFLHKHHFSHDLIHMNQKGKNVFCRKIVLKVFGNAKPMVTTLHYMHTNSTRPTGDRYNAARATGNRGTKQKPNTQHKGRYTYPRNQHNLPSHHVANDPTRDTTQDCTNYRSEWPALPSNNHTIMNKRSDIQQLTHPAPPTTMNNMITPPSPYSQTNHINMRYMGHTVNNPLQPQFGQFGPHIPLAPFPIFNPHLPHQPHFYYPVTPLV
ncbi:hypothetical protein M8J76_005739 [Diaphorina citri]|nr:hypothetical protein M8J75_002892 [Diaphorina citri]KAI5740636.1 hypothetical protein M8J76_005739 [Diaphorina citri]